MTWMPSETECVCFGCATADNEFDAEDDCYCNGEDDAEEAVRVGRG